MSLEREENKKQAINELESERSKLKIKDYTLSVSELVNQYKDGELVIKPEYQRAFRWDRDKKSMLIESMLLGLPIPPLFVAENSKGEYELIDGLQRSATIISFLGDLKDIDNVVNQANEFSLVNCKILSQLEGFKFKELPDVIKIKFKRYRLSLVIIENDSSMEVKYDMFKRLNTNSEQLSPQELRNCIYRGELNNSINTLAKNENFRKILALSPKKAEKMQYEESILRVLAFTFDDMIKKYRTISKSFSDKGYLDYFMENFEENTITIEYAIEEYFKTLKELQEYRKRRLFTAFDGRQSATNFDMLSVYILKEIIFNHEDTNSLDLRNIYVKYSAFIESEEIKKELDAIANSSRTRTLDRIKLFNDYIESK